MNSPAVNANNLEGSTLALWAEFLGGYFDGNSHAIGVNAPVAFPKATIRFQESALPEQMKDGIGISIVWVSPSKIEKRWDTLTAPELTALPVNTPKVQERACAHCGWIFLVRSVTAGGDANMQKQVADAAGLLYGLLQNSGAMEPMAEKGIKHVRPMTPRMAMQGDGAPSADTAYRLRVISCRGVLRYFIASQEQITG